MALATNYRTEQDQMGWDDGAEWIKAIGAAEWIAAPPATSLNARPSDDCLDVMNAENDGMGVTWSHSDGGVL